MRAAPPHREALERDYRAALDAHLSGAGEVALQRGYELGRRAITEGLGALALIAVHETTLREALRERPPEEGAALALRAIALLAEALSPFEMGFLGFKEANETLRSLNETLEARNDELSAARADALREAASERAARLELERVHEELKGAQGRLVQSEKLASLGQLVAGVAHEINNPLAFVINDAAVLGRDVASLRALLDLYREADELIATARPELRARLRALSDRMDAERALEGLSGLLERSRGGLRRIQKIVTDLRDFVRLDDGEMQEADLNVGVLATLEIVRGRATDRGVTLESDRASLPLVTCYPAKINQVLLNLVVNAIDACAPGGTVSVSSRPTPEGVRIDVSDDGVGIDPGVYGRIFDPFFTTKPQGQGTGLGLSTSYGIVTEHGGRIVVASSPGQGARFTVLLPMVPPARRAGLAPARG